MFDSIDIFTPGNIQFYYKSWCKKVNFFTPEKLRSLINHGVTGFRIFPFFESLGNKTNCLVETLQKYAGTGQVQRNYIPKGISGLAGRRTDQLRARLAEVGR